MNGHMLKNFCLRLDVESDWFSQSWIFHPLLMALRVRLWPLTYDYPFRKDWTWEDLCDTPHDRNPQVLNRWEPIPIILPLLEAKSTLVRPHYALGHWSPTRGGNSRYRLDGSLLRIPMAHSGLPSAATAAKSPTTAVFEVKRIVSAN